MDSDRVNVIVCMKSAGMPNPIGEAKLTVCFDCGVSLWVGEESFRAAGVDAQCKCFECAEVDLDAQGAAPPTEEQLQVLAEALGDEGEEFIAALKKWKKKKG